MTPLSESLRRQTSRSPITGVFLSWPEMGADPRIEGIAGRIATDDNLIRFKNLADIAPAGMIDLDGAEFTIGEGTTFAHVGGKAYDRIVPCLTMDLCKHGIGNDTMGEKSLATDRRQLGGIAEHQDRDTETQQIVPNLVIDHRALVDDDEAGARRRTLAIEAEPDSAIVVDLGLVKQGMDRCGVITSTQCHHQRSLAGIGRITDRAAHNSGQVTRDCGLPGSGEAEEPENLLLFGAPDMPLNQVSTLSMTSPC